MRSLRRRDPEERRGARLLRLCLLTWPRATRERDGEALLRAFRDDAGRDGPGRERPSVLSECIAIVAAGVSMRGRAVWAALRTATSGWSSDLWLATRGLRRSPGFAGAVTLTLAIGIGANAAVFGLVDRVLFTPPPYEDPASLVLVWNTLGRSSDRFRVPAPDAGEIRRRSDVFADLAFVARAADGAVEATDGGGAEHVRWAAVTTNLFDVLGVPPALGPGFTSPQPSGAEDGSGVAGASVVLSDAAWRTLLGADPRVVGREIRLNGQPVWIAGVMPPDFRVALPPAAGMGGAVGVWTALAVPLQAFARLDGREIDQDSDNSGAVVARLRPGVSVEQAGAEVRRVAAELRAEVPSYGAAGRDAVVRPMHDDATAHLRGLLTALLIGVGSVLLASCLNVSTLVVARGARRRRELAVRAALGARPHAILRQLAAEALVLAGAGIAVAFLVADAAARAMSNWIPADLVGSVQPGGADVRMVVLAAMLATAGTLGFALAPAARSIRSGARGLLASDLGNGSGGDRARAVLVAGQVAVSVVLVFATTLLLRTASELSAADPGFEPEGALTFALSLRTPGRYTGPADRARLVREIETTLAELPGVGAVGSTAHLPLSGRSWTQPYGLSGPGEVESGGNRADFRTVTSGYFAAIGARILEGRSFTSDEDLEERRRVAVVDRRLAERLAAEGTGTALGTTLFFPLDGAVVEAEVVGVVEHVRHETLGSDGREALYVPFRQEASRDVAFVVRAERDPLVLAPAVRDAIRSIDPQLPVHGLRTLADYVDGAIAPTRFVTGVLAIFAALVLLSVAVGLYGVVALDVTRRTRDVGIRLAVGAERWTVVRDFLERGIRLAGAGALVGCGATIALHRLVAAVPSAPQPTDPLAWAAVVGVVFAVTLSAVWLPAWRASRLDATVALKAE